MVKLPVKGSPSISAGSTPSIVYGTVVSLSTPCVLRVMVNESPSLTNEVDDSNSNVGVDVSSIVTLTLTPILSNVNVNVSLPSTVKSSVTLNVAVAVLLLTVKLPPVNETPPISPGCIPDIV